MTRERGLRFRVVERLDDVRNPGRGIQIPSQLLRNEVLVDALWKRCRWPTNTP